MKIINIASAAVCILFLLSCATTEINPNDISSVDFTLNRFFSSDITAVTPGNKYKVKISVSDAQGKTVKNPDHTNFIVQSPNSSFSIIKQTPRSVEVLATEDTLSIAHKEAYSLAVSLPQRSELKTQHTFNIDWAPLKSLDYSGSSGNDGSDGSNGSGGSSYSEYNLDGGDGSDGSDGSNGASGEDVIIAICAYDVSDLNISGIEEDSMLIIYDLSSNKIQLIKKQNIIIDTSGGNGGNGGDGGDGGSAGTYTNQSSGSFGSSKTGTEGRGGSGGDGGDGGNAGNLTLYYFDENILALIQPRLTGGNGGSGGNAGKNGTFGGSTGFSGHSGDFSKIQIPKDEFIAKILQSNNKNIKEQRLIFIR